MRTHTRAATLLLALAACDDKVEVDDSSCTPTTWYADVDGDGYGDPAVMVEDCLMPSGHVADATDCDDTQAFIRPGVDERCDELDNDCDDEVDEEAVDASTWYPDLDEDGFGDDGAPLVRCDQLPTHVAQGGDCDDNDNEAFPGNTEICDGIDNDCDTATPEAGMATFIPVEGEIADYTDRFDGGPGGLAELSFTERGELRLCPGTWYAQLEVENDLTITGIGGRDEVVLNADGLGPLIRIEEDELLVMLSGLSLTNATGDIVDASGNLYGGAVDCIGTTELVLTDVHAYGNTSAGGSVVTSDGCEVRIEGSEIEGNVCDVAASVFVNEGTLDLVDTRIWGNSGGYGGGVTLIDSVATCTSASDSGAGIYANTSTGFGSGVLLNESTFDSQSCDFGEADTANDNAIDDLSLTFLYGNRYRYGDDATVSCDSTRCGTASASSVGQAGGSEAQGSAARGNVFVVGEDITLESFEVHLSATSTSCMVYFSVLEAASPDAAEWTVIGVRSGRPTSTAGAYMSSGTLGTPMIAGRAYATVVGSTCTLTLSPEDYTTPRDGGPAEMGAYYWARSGDFAELYGALIDTGVQLGNDYTVYATQYAWSH